MKYESHNLIDNKIDWKSYFPETSYNGWVESFVKYKKLFVYNRY